jgi:transposase-like protein
MKTYPEEFKTKIIAQMLPPHNRSIPDLARETGIPKDTLYTWRGKHRPLGGSIQTGRSARLTSPEKFQLVVDSATLNEHELGEFCRRRGVFPEQLAAWREACRGANDERPRPKAGVAQRELSRRNAELEAELRRKEKALAEAAALLVLEKKVRVLWAEPEDGSSPSRNGGS